MLRSKPLHVLVLLLTALVVCSLEPASAADRQPARNPFISQLPPGGIQVRYKLRGRYQGEAVFTAKGERSIYRVKATDNAFGLERPVEFIRLETPEYVVAYDLVTGRAVRRPNLRGVLGILWRNLEGPERAQVVKNTRRLAKALSPLIGGGRVRFRPKREMLGLDASLVIAAGRQVWYWAGTDIVLHEIRQVAGQTWIRTAEDLITDTEIPDSAFDLPAWLPEPMDEIHWLPVWMRAARMIELLKRPLIPVTVSEEEIEQALVLLGEKDSADAKAKASDRIDRTEAEQTRAIPWPVAPPPDFRTAAARYRVSPQWRPYPRPPWTRPWPPPGLEAELLARQVTGLAEMINALKP